MSLHTPASYSLTSITFFATIQGMNEGEMDFRSDKDLVIHKIKWDRVDHIQRFELSRFAVGSAFDENIVKICDAFLPSQGIILDVGAGTGELRRRMPEHFANRTVHSDISPTYMGILKKESPHAAAVVADATSLPFDVESFDALISLSTYHTIDDLEAAVAEAQRVLKPGGRFMNILDITPSAAPILEYLKQRATFLFPADRVMEDNISHTAYQLTSASEILEFLDDQGDDLDPKLFHHISLILENPLFIYAGFDTDEAAKDEFVKELREAGFPGRIAPMTTLFQERLVEDLHREGFRDIEAGNVQSVKEVPNIWTPQLQDYNVIKKINGSGLGFNNPNVPPDRRVISSSVQCITAIKA